MTTASSLAVHTSATYRPRFRFICLAFTLAPTLAICEPRLWSPVCVNAHSLAKVPSQSSGQRIDPTLIHRALKKTLLYFHVAFTRIAARVYVRNG